MQRFLQLLLGLVGQRGLEDGAAVLGQRGRGLVRGHLLDHHEQRRRARLQHLTDLVLEGLINAGLADTPDERPYACPDGQAEERDEKEKSEEEPPEQPPGGPIGPATSVVICLAVPRPGSAGAYAAAGAAGAAGAVSATEVSGLVTCSRWPPTPASCSSAAVLASRAEGSARPSPNRAPTNPHRRSPACRECPGISPSGLCASIRRRIPFDGAKGRDSSPRLRYRPALRSGSPGHLSPGLPQIRA